MVLMIGSARQVVKDCLGNTKDNTDFQTALSNMNNDATMSVSHIRNINILYHGQKSEYSRYKIMLVDSEYFAIRDKDK
jgi:hypothetical protein